MIDRLPADPTLALLVSFLFCVGVGIGFGAFIWGLGWFLDWLAGEDGE